MSTYGIDLGTTYSCIARLDQNGNPEVVRNNEDNSNTLASVVFFENENNVIVGQVAKDNIETDGDRVVQFVKRWIGKANARTYEFDGKSYTPVEISALILTRLKNIVESQGDTIDNVVITVPAYFGLEERSATKQAGELAGLNVLNLINEPTAAALSYCARQFQEDRTILVYDLGGGTFDVTIINMSMTEGGGVQKITVLATGGDDQLGGKDWDDRLFDYILNACCEENGLSKEEIDAETRQDIRSKVEEAKRKLSQKEKTKVRIDVNGSRTEIVITRNDFERMTADIVGRTMNFVDKTLSDVKKNYDINDTDIDTVLLVGGSTYMPMIKEAVEKRFPDKVQQHDPDQAVAKGAAIYASMIGLDVENATEGMDSSASEGESEDSKRAELAAKFTVEDQTPRSFGPGVIDTKGSKNKYILENFIKIGEKMPAIATKTYYPIEDNQERVRLRAFENMSMDDALIPCVNEEGEPQATDPAHGVKLLGELIVNLPPNTPKTAPIQVTFKVDASGVHVEAINTTTGDKFETFLRTASDIDIEKSAVHQLRISSD